MTDETPNLVLPYIMAAQAQKHVTHNEALRNLDAVVQLSVKDRDLTTPPLEPSNGDRYIPAAGSADDWAGKDGQIAAFQDNSWQFYSPAEGWRCWVADEQALLVHNGVSWETFSSGGGGGVPNTVASSTYGAETKFEILEEELTLSGATTDSTIAIPQRAIVHAVTSRTTQTITGATSYNCGIAAETGKYGGSLGIAVNSSNSGVTGPTAFYSDTPLRLTANGSDFTGGKVRLAIHYMLCTIPTS